MDLIWSRKGFSCGWRRGFLPGDCVRMVPMINRDLWDGNLVDVAWDLVLSFNLGVPELGGYFGIHSEDFGFS